MRDVRVVCAGLALLTLAACGTTPDEPTTAPTATSTPAPATTTPPATAPAPMSDAENTGEPMEELTEDSGATEEVPVWDEAAQEEAATRAAAFMTAFGRPTLAADEWLRGIQGLMAPEARDWFAYVDPADVPVTAVTGDPQVRDLGSAYVTEVVVPTDAGDYLVTLTRRTGGDPFLVTTAAPVE